MTVGPDGDDQLSYVYVLCASGAVGTHGFMLMFFIYFYFLCAIYKFVFIH